jgi:hypothetical protein
MDWVPYVKERIPAVIRGITQVVAANVGQPAATEDPTPQFMEKRLAILSKYQSDLKVQADRHQVGLKEKADTPPRAPTPGKTVTPAATGECPYCNLEELAGVVRNHMLFVAQECKDDDLGPATGGMIPKAKTSTEDFIRKAESLDAETHIQLVAQLAVMKAQELLPRLEWIHNCAEAQEAATIADEMWHRAAKATQMYYATTPDSPYR